jgi:hypothetical protein
LARESAKSGTFSVSKVMSPRTRSFHVIEPSGIRNRTTGARPSASKAARCSADRSRQKPSYPCIFEPEAWRRAVTSSLVQKQS